MVMIAQRREMLESMLSQKTAVWIAAAQAD
jgi:hypothetical protein